MMDDDKIDGRLSNDNFEQIWLIWPSSEERRKYRNERTRIYLYN